MDSLLANYASDDDDDERGGVVQEEKSAAESLQLPPPKPSAAFSSSLFSTLPPPRSLASASSHPATIPSWSTPSHLGELDGDKEESGILATGTPSSTAFKAQSSLFSSLLPPKPSSSFSGPTSRQLGGERSEEEEDKADVFTTYTTSSNSFSAQKSMFSSIPPPKDTSTPSLFSSVAPPKFEQPNPLNIGNPPSSDRNPKKVVQFKLPLNPSLLKSEDSDDEEDNVNMRKRSVKDSSSNVPGASSSLFSILPAPKSTLGVVPSSATASSRRSVIDADFSASNTGEFTVAMENSAYGESGADEYYRGGWADAPTEIGAEDVNATGFVDSSAGGWDPLGMEEATHPGYDGSNAASYWDPSYGGAIDYGSYEGNWSETAAAVNSDVPELGRIAGKRGRNEFPSELMEVNQDELMKNRPRQDQSRLTGIAFGPSHQPASSAKGKPSKLHKRKHQIGSLFFDMKQKEMELAERRSRGLLTKAETQAKYGW